MPSSLIPICMYECMYIYANVHVHIFVYVYVHMYIVYIKQKRLSDYYVLYVGTQSFMLNAIIQPTK